MDRISYKDLPARKAAAKPANAPLNKDRLRQLSGAMAQVGIDTTAIQAALASGTPDSQFQALTDTLNLFLFPDLNKGITAVPVLEKKDQGRQQPPAPLPGHPVKRAGDDHSGLKASQDPYANLTRGWFNP